MRGAMIGFMDFADSADDQADAADNEHDEAEDESADSDSHGVLYLPFFNDIFHEFLFSHSFTPTLADGPAGVNAVPMIYVQALSPREVGQFSYRQIPRRRTRVVLYDL